MKRLLGAVLAVLMVFTLSPFALADDNTGAGSTSGTLTTEHFQIEYALDEDGYYVDGDGLAIDLVLTISATQVPESQSEYGQPLCVILMVSPSYAGGSYDIGLPMEGINLQITQDGEQLLLRDINAVGEPAQFVTKTYEIELASGVIADIDLYVSEDEMDLFSAVGGTPPTVPSESKGTFSIESYSVEYASGVSDGSVSGVPGNDATDGGSYTIPTTAAPSRSGYIFRGWSDGTAVYQPGATITGISDSVTLTATWEAYGDVEINWPTLPTGVTSGTQAGWGSSPDTDGDVDFTLTLEAGYIPSSLAVTVNGRTVTATGGTDGAYGYTFNVAGYDSPITIAVSAPVKPVVTFESNGGSAVEPQTVNYNGLVTEPAEPTRENYTFGGWYADEALTDAWDFTSDAVTANRTLYAKWNVIPTYSIDIVPTENGKVTASASSAREGDTVTLTVAPARGYELSRLYIIQDGGDAVEYTKLDAVTYTFEMPAAGVDVFAEFRRVIDVPDTHDISVGNTANGSVSTSLSNASEGSVITVTAEPDEGYRVGSVDVTGPDGRVNVTRVNATTYTFVMPDGDVTVSVSFVRVTMPFVDVATGAWYYDAVNYVWSNGLMEGTSATTFEPDTGMTRAMVWAVLARMDGQSVSGVNWVTAARSWAMAEGVSDGTDPNSLITREQLATMLWRYAGSPAATGNGISAFTDAGSVSSWAVDAMNWALEQGIITGMGDGTLSPQGTATRAQAAAILMRFVER